MEFVRKYQNQIVAILQAIICIFGFAAALKGNSAKKDKKKGA